jgi:hypothetical protein
VAILAVREENSIVARVTLNKMSQDREETVRAYGARLHGQAGVCKFTLECAHCNHTVNYTDGVLRHALLDLLGAEKQNMTL